MVLIIFEGKLKVILSPHQLTRLRLPSSKEITKNIEKFDSIILNYPLFPIFHS
jgi:hypothetical protein